jgi:hypothetical protein
MALSGNDVARTLALITISLEQQPGCKGRDMAAYDAIEKADIIASWSAEYKAELYARTIEHERFNGMYMDLQSAIADGLRAVQRKFSV